MSEREEPKESQGKLNAGARAALGWARTLPGPTYAMTLWLHAPVFACGSCQCKFKASLPEGLDPAVADQGTVQCPRCLRSTCKMEHGVVEVGQLLAEEIT